MLKLEIIKVIEVIPKFTESWEAAAQNAIYDASKSFDNITSIYIKEFKASVNDNKRMKYIVNAKIS